MGDPGKRVLWVGWTVTVLVSLLFLLSASMKVIGGLEVSQGMEHLGLPESMILPLAILELLCVLVYAVPATSVLGAVLLTGYLGGAICSHWRVDDPVLVPIVLGLFVWLGIFLREPRLKALLPFRRY